MSLRPSGAPEVPLDGIAGGPVMVKVPFGPSKGKERVRSILRGEGGFPLSLVLTGGTAVVSGAAAAAWKVRSGDLAARDPVQADPAVRARVRRLDRSAAIALVVMQAGIAAFLSLLLSD